MPGILIRFPILPEESRLRGEGFEEIERGGKKLKA